MSVLAWSTFSLDDWGDMDIEEDALFLIDPTINLELAAVEITSSGVVAYEVN